MHLSESYVNAREFHAELKPDTHYSEWLGIVKNDCHIADGFVTCDSVTEDNCSRIDCLLSKRVVEFLIIRHCVDNDWHQYFYLMSKFNIWREPIE